ncbi:hypothetical protein ABPG72_018990 [Tetrahymena utriculariae]
MKIKFLLLNALCLLGLCISQKIDLNILEKLNHEGDFDIHELFQASQQAKTDVQELLKLFERDQQTGGKYLIDAYQNVQKDQKQFLGMYQSEFSCYKCTCGIESQIPSSKAFYQCIHSKCVFQYNDGAGVTQYFEDLHVKTYECLLSLDSDKTKPKNDQKTLQKEDNKSAKVVDDKKTGINIYELFQASEQAKNGVQELLKLFEREKENGGKCLIDAYQNVQKDQKQYFSVYQNELSFHKRVCGFVSKIPSSEALNQCIDSKFMFQYNDDAGANEYFEDLHAKTYVCLLKKASQNEDSN